MANKLPHNIEQRRFNLAQNTSPYRGWDKLGRFYYVRQDKTSKLWHATGRDHVDELTGANLTELANKLANHGELG